MAHTFDVVIIGGGPGGTAAARTLAAGGKSVALIEEDSLGGVCLNRGCIPTKFLLAATAPIGAVADHKRFGTFNGEIGLDFAALQKRKDRFIKGSVSALAKSLENAGISVFSGKGRITAPGKVAVEGAANAELETKNIILAVGSRSATFPGLMPDGDAILDSTQLLRLDAAPQSLLVIGAGAIGLEFADFFAALGVNVSIIEGMPTFVPSEDADIGDELRKILQKSGRACIVGQKVASLSNKNGQAELVLENGDIHTAEKALIAVGRRPNTENLGVENAGGALTQRGFVAVDGALRAFANGYAIGDCNGATLLAHAAEHQGEWVARHILGKETGDYAAGPVPSCVFGGVEVMRAGKTAKEAAASGGAVTVSKAPFTVNPIAQAHAATSGFAKAVWQDGKLVGMAAVGHGASHLVTAAQLLVLRETTLDSLHAFMFAHPTLDEALRSALAAPQEPFAAS